MPPGNNTSSPSEMYWKQMDAEASKTGEIMMGGSMNALINWGFFVAQQFLTHSSLMASVKFNLTLRQ